MNYCVKCGQNLRPHEARWFAPPPIGQRVVKCQSCGPFRPEEVAYVARVLSHASAQPQMRPMQPAMGGCACRGRR